MGWNEVWPINASNLFKKSLDDNDEFYFVHSYHAKGVPLTNQLASSFYGYDFTCAVRHENIYGVQFHPEKSHKYGKNLLNSFLDLV